MPAGRPTIYSEALVDDLLEWMASGNSVSKWCAKSENPSISTVFRWLQDPEKSAFRERYARAQDARAEKYADEVVDIVDEESDSQRARVRMDARRWAAGVMMPQKYALQTRTKLQHSGDPDNPVVVTFAELARSARDEGSSG